MHATGQNRKVSRMVDALTTAFAEVDRMRLNASKAAGSPGQMLASGPQGLEPHRPSLTKAKEQYQHFRGWAYVAIKAIASRIAGQDVFVARLRETPRTGRKSDWLKSTLPGRLKSLGERLEPLENHPLLQAIDDPNPIMVRWPLMFATVASLKLTGRAFWWLVEDHGKLNVWPIPSHWIEPGDLLRGTWKLKPFGGIDEIELPGESIASFYLPDPSNPFACISPLQSQAAAVATDEQIQTSQHRAFINGLHPGMAIKVGRLPGMQPGMPGDRPVLEPEQRAELIDMVRKLYGGVMRREDPIIIDGLIEGIERLTNLPSEMDYLDSGKQTKARIMQAFGVNPIIVGETEGANRAQAWVAEKSFCDNTCNPIVELLSQVLTAWVGHHFASDGEKLVVWVSPCRADDPELKLQEWKDARQGGIVTQNEYRTNVLNLPAVEGGDVFRDALGNPIESRSADPILQLGASRNGSARR